MAKFENRFLTPIQGFTQSKIEKAKTIHVRLRNTPEWAAEDQWGRILEVLKDES